MDHKGTDRSARVSFKSSESRKGTKKNASCELPKRGSSASPSPKDAPQSASRSSSPAQKRNSSPRKKSSSGTGRAAAKEEKDASAAAAVPEPLQVTLDALASINYAALKKGSLSAKQRKAQTLKEFLAAHSMGAHHIDVEWKKGYEALWDEYLHISHTLHSREIQRLMEKLRQSELSCQRRLQHATAVTQCALGGIEELLVRLIESGTHIGEHTQMLSGEPDPVLAANEVYAAISSKSEPNQKEEGTPMPEVRGLDSVKSDPHPPAFRFAEAERERVARLKEIFARATESINARKEHGSCAGSSSFSSPVKSILSDAQGLTRQGTMVYFTADAHNAADTVGTEDRQAPKEMFSGIAVAEEGHLHQVDELYRELSTVGDAFVSLMKSVEMRHQQYQAKITAQRTALDAAATRTKLADDVLRGTVAQGEVEAYSAVAEVQQLSLELRRRMDASEAAMQTALDALIQESAAVCVTNDALHEYASLTSNRENCLYKYMTRMERQVVEQVDVLRQAQDTTTRLWSRIHTPAQQQQQVQTAINKDAGNSGGTFALPDRTNEKNSSLPPLYLQLLRQSDRPSLLDLAEQLSQCSTEVARLVVRVLDEQKAHNALHPTEAAIAREAHLRTVATQKLLEKLDAEGYLRSNTHQTTLPLSERITHVVSLYDAYIDFNEQYARALVRQADVERREHSPSQFAFFDHRTPVPSMTNAANSMPAVPDTPVKGAAAPKTYTAAPAIKTGSGGKPCTTTEPAVSLPYLQLWEEKQREAQQHQQQGLTAATEGLGGTNSASTGCIVNYLARTASTPGLVPSLPYVSTSGLVGRRHTSIGATVSTCAAHTPTPPPLPPRMGLTSYVLDTYTSKDENANIQVESIAQSLASGKRTTGRTLPYRDGDRQFIERQREVFQQLD